MKIYTLHENRHYNPIMGVFETAEKAQEYVDFDNARNPYADYDIPLIYVWDLDTNILIQRILGSPVNGKIVWS